MAFLYVVPERIDVQSFCRPRPAAFWQIVFGVTSSIIIFWLKKLKNYIENRQTNILQSVKFEDTEDRAELKPYYKKMMLFLNQKIDKTFNGKIK